MAYNIMKLFLKIVFLQILVCSSVTLLCMLPSVAHTPNISLAMPLLYWPEEEEPMTEF